jgi:hypothetical protein
VKRLASMLATGAFLLSTAPVALAYSPTNAASYANQWVRDSEEGGALRNPDYPNFGNDCANFVSQALFAGGYDMQGFDGDTTKYVNWYIYKENFLNWKHSMSWGSASNLLNFLYYDGPGGSPLAHKTPAQGTSGFHQSGGATGDVIFYDWGLGEGISHVAIQVGYGIDNQAPAWEGSLVDYHTTDREKAFWSLRPHNANRAATTYFTVVKINSAN